MRTTKTLVQATKNGSRFLSTVAKTPDASAEIPAATRYSAEMARETYVKTMEMDVEAKRYAADRAYKAAMNAAWLRALTTLGVGTVAALLTYVWVRPLEQKLKETQEELSETRKDNAAEIAELRRQLGAAGQQERALKTLFMNAQAQADALAVILAKAEARVPKTEYESYKTRVMSELATKIKANKRRSAVGGPEDENPTPTPVQKMS